MNTGQSRGFRRIAGHIDRAPSGISREIRPNPGLDLRLPHGPKRMSKLSIAADAPRPAKIDADPVLRARVLGDLKRSRTPRQIEAWLRLEASDPTVDTPI